MSAGPLRRATAATGLLAIIPVALLLILGALTPEDAALRALAIVAGVVVIGNLARMVLTTTLNRVERRQPDEETATATAARGDVMSSSD